jgi:hypothetical protein
MAPGTAHGDSAAAANRQFGTALGSAHIVPAWPKEGSGRHPPRLRVGVGGGHVGSEHIVFVQPQSKANPRDSVRDGRIELHAGPTALLHELAGQQDREAAGRRAHLPV